MVFIVALVASAEIGQSTAELSLYRAEENKWNGELVGK